VISIIFKYFKKTILSNVFTQKEQLIENKC